MPSHRASAPPPLAGDRSGGALGRQNSLGFDPIDKAKVNKSDSKPNSQNEFLIPHLAQATIHVGQLVRPLSSELGQSVISPPQSIGLVD